MGQTGKWINYDEVAATVIFVFSILLIAVTIPMGWALLKSGKISSKDYRVISLIFFVGIFIIGDSWIYQPNSSSSPIVLEATEMLDEDGKRKNWTMHVEFRENNTCRFYEPREHGETYFETKYEQHGDTFFIDISGQNSKMIPYRLVQKGDFMKGEVTCLHTTYTK